MSDNSLDNLHSIQKLQLYIWSAIFSQMHLKWQQSLENFIWLIPKLLSIRSSSDVNYFLYDVLNLQLILDLLEVQQAVHLYLINE